MTREEASFVLANIDRRVCDDELSDALDMAIKALEQEPCEECVSRQAVIDTIYSECTGTKLDIDFAKVLILQRAIKALPSVTPIRPKGHWIWVFDETPSTPNSPYEVNYAGWVCSCCHKFPDDICEWDDPDEPPTYKCCPNCGAKMESEKA